MVVVLKGHDFSFTLKNICYLFFPGEKITVTEDEKAAGDTVLFTSVEKEGGRWRATAVLRAGGSERELEHTVAQGEDVKLTLGKLCFLLLQAFTGITPQWGTLTGVKPVKLYFLLRKKLGDEALVERALREEYLVSEEKIKLVKQVADIQAPLVNREYKKDCALYISIPFCPSRCSYCSFVSQSVERQGQLVAPHLECLLTELEMTARWIAGLGFRVRAIYIGGGTPTILKGGQLDALLTKVGNLFDVGNLMEYTLEAGRPDTIDKTKLTIAKQSDITRLNINPQSLNDQVLQQAGRRHTAKDIFDKFYLARELGFHNINMDLIAGLRGDTQNSFRGTIEGVMGLRPENVTVHTLYMKRASDDVVNHRAQFKATDEEVGQMVQFAQEALKGAGYKPFYMYRQRNTVDNLENTGYTLEGCESPYNIWTMDDTLTVFGCGAGAVTKLVNRGENKLKRIPNYKLPLEYIKNFDQMEQKGEEIAEFFKN